MSDKTVAWNDGVNPVHSGLFLVNRDKLGTPYRWFDADTGEWSRCEYIFEDVAAAKGTKSPVGFLPWRGPVRAERIVATVNPVVAKLQNGRILPLDAEGDAKMRQEMGLKPSASVTEVKVAKVKPEKKAKPAKVAKVKVAKAPKVAALPDGTVFFRADRQKWVVVIDGKQPAARPTKEGVLSWLAKKYPDVKAIVV